MAALRACCPRLPADARREGRRLRATGPCRWPASSRGRGCPPSAWPACLRASSCGRGHPGRSSFWDTPPTSSLLKGKQPVPDGGGRGLRSSWRPMAAPCPSTWRWTRECTAWGGQRPRWRSADLCPALLRIQGSTHLCTADGTTSRDQAYVHRQAQAFRELLERLQNQGIALPKVHLLASHGLLNHPRPEQGTMPGWASPSTAC